MIFSGLVSVTFRQLLPGQIVNLVRQAELEGIEWGGDIHVPHGDIGKAKEVSDITKSEGLKIFAYGSYYVAGESEKEGLPFKKVLETAISLDAPIIRVWAGKRGSALADENYRNNVISDTRRIAEAAESAGIIISFEFHKNSLTDTSESASRLVRETAHENIRLYWQPILYADVNENLKAIDNILPWLTNIHVFNWCKKKEEFGPLADACDAWRCYLQRIKSSGKKHAAMLEFVSGNSEESFIKDAQIFRELLKKINH